jgi:phosphohistidine phosphatase
MKTLLLMRHAKSDWNQPGLTDHDRPLNARGRRAAPLMAHKLSASGLQVDIILASSAIRVQETVELLQQHWSPQIEVLTLPSLYLASPQQIITEVQSLHDSWQSAMVVAHNPGLAALVSHLANQELDMPTAAVAVFQFAVDQWSKILVGGVPELVSLWKPREIEGD